MRADFAVTYEVITADGDEVESGFDITKEVITPDSIDCEFAVDAGLDPVVYVCLTEASSIYATNWSFCPPTKGSWLTSEPTQDMHSGEWESKSIHFDGLTDSQWEALFDSIP